MNDSIKLANIAFAEWRLVPAPIRGEFVRLIGEEVRSQKEYLAKVITAEVGKPIQESLGEVQEVIDICEFAVGLSRQLHGITMPSERPEHNLMEQWHPLGTVGVITAFNFPMAVWAWNAALALVCGNAVIWKPSDKAEACATAMENVVYEAAKKAGNVPANLCPVVFGGVDAGKELAESRDVHLVSATGSTAMGREVAKTVAGRLGKYLLELGGNNATIVMPSADLGIAINGIVFSAIGTSGQRCTSLRRLLVHEDIFDDVVDKLKTAYNSVRVGDPSNPNMHMGPLIDSEACYKMNGVIHDLKGDNVRVYQPNNTTMPEGNYVLPTLVIDVHPNDKSCAAKYLQVETFAPILYIVKIKSLEEGISIQNDVSQGLSSSIFTNDVRESGLFLSCVGSDCGIANVNIGTSGAEIGGAFGGEKDTGGGRESGSDAWKNYMRRATNTINYSDKLPLAQGIEFDI